MADVFISYVEEDSAIATELSDGLEAARYSTWCYERHSMPGPSYLAQTRSAIEACSVFLLVISRDSLGSNQIDKEVVRAHETGKRFLPVLRGISHAEFHARQPEWGQAAGGATSIAIPAGGVQAILPRIAKGMDMLGVKQSLAIQRSTHKRPSDASDTIPPMQTRADANSGGSLPDVELTMSPDDQLPQTSRPGSASGMDNEKASSLADVSDCRHAADMSSQESGQYPDDHPTHEENDAAAPASKWWRLVAAGLIVTLGVLSWVIAQHIFFR